MANVYLDLTGRFDSAFGFAIKNVLGRVIKLNPYRFEQLIEFDDEFEDVTISYDGTELNFAAFPFIKQNKRALHLPFKKPFEPEFGDVIAPPPLISFNRSKNLVVTDLNGEDNEVVERWNTAAYEVRMRGILIDMKNHNYPTTLVEQMHDLFEHNDILEVSGTQFFEKDISFIYALSIEMSGVVGYTDTVQYTITAKATKDVNFTLLNPN